MTKLNRRTVLKGGAALASLAAAGCATTGQLTRSKPSRILILGGTNFLGPQLVDAAQRRGHTLTLFNRGKTHPGLFPNIEQLHGDRDGHLEALQGRTWDAVIDTSGFVPRIVQASAELLAKSVPHYVFISTISVYADLDKPGVDESSPVASIADPTNEDVGKNYGALKALCERAAKTAMPGRTTVIRPGLIVGRGDPTDRFTYWPARLARGGRVLAPGDGSDDVQFIDVRDLAEWAIHGVEARQMGTFNALGPQQPLTMRAFLEAGRATVGPQAKLEWVPTKFLEAHKVSPWSDMPVWIPASDMVGAGSIKNAKAVAAGLRFRPVRETFEDTLAWFRTLPPERQDKLKAGLSPEREAAVLADWDASRNDSATG